MNLRDELVSVALRWERRFGVAPSITSSLSEYDAAMQLGCTEEEYSRYMQGKTAVKRGFDFEYGDIKYQVKACRPSGKPGSKVTWVPKTKNYDWDCLIWILYDGKYDMQESWQWKMKDYKREFGDKNRLSPADMQRGEKLL